VPSFLTPSGGPFLRGRPPTTSSAVASPPPLRPGIITGIADAGPKFTSALNEVNRLMNLASTSSMYLVQGSEGPTADAPAALLSAGPANGTSGGDAPLPAAAAPAAPQGPAVTASSVVCPDGKPEHAPCDPAWNMCQYKYCASDEFW
jgi:hypothetical protein